MELKQLLLKYESDNNKSHIDVASEVGVSLSTYYRWINGESLKLKKGTIDRLSKVLGLNVDLVVEESQRLKPIMGFVKAGYDLLADENIEGYIELGEADALKGDYFLRVKGDSMIGSNIFDGDLVYVEKCDYIKSGQIGIVMVGDEVTIKKVHYKNELMILEASNPNYESKFFSKDEIESLPVKVIGLARFVRRDLV